MMKGLIACYFSSLGHLTFNFVAWVEAVTAITVAFLRVYLGPPPVPCGFDIVLQDPCNVQCTGQW